MEPWGDERADRRTMRAFCTLANILRGGKHEWNERDFVPQYVEVRQVRMTEDDIWAGVQSVAKSLRMGRETGRGDKAVKP